MDAKKAVFFSLFMVVMLASFASAEDIIYRVIPIDDDISIYEEAKFNISVVNIDEIDHHISIYSPNVDRWSVRISPDSFPLKPNTRKWVEVRIKPKANVESGQEYGIQLNVRSEETDQLLKGFAYINVKSQDELNREYLPVITLEAEEIQPIDPTEDTVLSMTLENKNVRDIKNLQVIVNSDFVTKDTFTDLGPLQEKTIQFPLIFPNEATPGNDNFIVQLKLGNDTISSKSFDYTVKAVEKIETNADVTSSFLKKEYAVTLKNIGNLKTTAEYSIKTNILNYFLIWGNSDARFDRTDGFKKIFFVTLEPGQQASVQITTSYRPILYFVLALIIIVTLYYLLRSPLVIKKSVSSIKTKEDSLSELKILLHIKNRTKKNIDELIILDRIPKITEVGKEFELGTIKPAKIMNHEKKGTIIKWEINALDSYEERVIAYKIFTNLKILGGMTLPLAILKYKLKGGREKAISSNKINLVIKRFTGEKK